MDGEMEEIADALMDDEMEEIIYILDAWRLEEGKPAGRPASFGPDSASS